MYVNVILIREALLMNRIYPMGLEDVACSAM